MEPNGPIRFKAYFPCTITAFYGSFPEQQMQMKKKKKAKKH